MKKHRKHAKLTLRNNGDFGPNEVAFVGVKCGAILDLVTKISAELHARVKIAYADASHGKDNIAPVFDTYTYHASGDTIISSDIKKNIFNERIRFSNYDLVLVNGNHFPAKKQIVFLDPEKENSIEKRIEQLNDVQFFIRTQKDFEVFSCLKEKYPNYKEIPVYSINDISAISIHILQLVQQEVPKLNGLVLIGGKSTRMGEDKSQLSYYGIPQGDYTVQLLENKGLETYVSVRADQKAENRKTIEDAFVGLGPFGAICSAFRENPNEAYLVLATDLPYVSDELLKTLLKKRNPKKIATAIKGKSSKFMEPLITIWEPKAYPVLLSYLAQGYSCPRKILINSDVEIVEVEDDLIRNVNTPDEFENIKQELNTLK
ncbi:NTP transferase domain-containing protein [Flavicella sp.]|uniref:NTP transferase domain-containing protein n=1 Tax=Flavicella sp. TaxID=2957742 RepID=UPI003016E407